MIKKSVVLLCIVLVWTVGIRAGEEQPVEVEPDEFKKEFMSGVVESEISFYHAKSEGDLDWLYEIKEDVVYKKMIAKNSCYTALEAKLEELLHLIEEEIEFNE